MIKRTKNCILNVCDLYENVFFDKLKFDIFFENCCKFIEKRERKNDLPLILFKIVFSLNLIPILFLSCAHLPIKGLLVKKGNLIKLEKKENIDEELGIVIDAPTIIPRKNSKEILCFKILSNTKYKKILIDINERKFKFI